MHGKQFLRLISIILIILLAACGGGEEAAESPVEQEADVIEEPAAEEAMDAEADIVIETEPESSEAARDPLNAQASEDTSKPTPRSPRTDKGETVLASNHIKATPTFTPTKILTPTVTSIPSMTTIPSKEAKPQMTLAQSEQILADVALVQSVLKQVATVEEGVGQFLRLEFK